MKQNFTCIICPNGCDITAELSDQGEVLSVSGNLCPNGEKYVREEVTAPKRNIATSVLVESGELPLASCRLTGPIPKERIFDAVREIHKVHLTAPVKAGQVILKDLLHLHVDVILTRSVKAKETK